MSARGGYVIYKDGEEVEVSEFEHSEYFENKQKILEILCFLLLTSDKLKFLNPDEIKMECCYYYCGLLKFTKFYFSKDVALSAVISENFEVLPRKNTVKIVSRTLHVVPFKPIYLKGWPQLLMMYCFDHKNILHCCFF